jgi:hypothetical protein
MTEVNDCQGIFHRGSDDILGGPAIRIRRYPFAQDTLPVPSPVAALSGSLPIILTPGARLRCALTAAHPGS